MALSAVGVVIGANAGTLVGTLVRALVGTLVGTFVGALVGTFVGAFVVTGMMSGADGAPLTPIYRISIPLMDGFSVTTAKSIVIVPSVTNAFIVTTFGMNFPGASRKMSKLSSTNDPSTDTSNTRLFTVL